MGFDLLSCWMLLAMIVWSLPLLVPEVRRVRKNTFQARSLGAAVEGVQKSSGESHEQKEKIPPKEEPWVFGVFRGKRCEQSNESRVMAYIWELQIKAEAIAAQ